MCILWCDEVHVSFAFLPFFVGFRAVGARGSILDVTMDEASWLVRSSWNRIRMFIRYISM